MAYTGMLSMHHVAARVTLRIRKKTYKLIGNVADITIKGFNIESKEKLIKKIDFFFNSCP